MIKFFVIAFIAFGPYPNNGQEIKRDNTAMSEKMCRLTIQQVFKERNRDKQIHLNWFATCREYRP